MVCIMPPKFDGVAFMTDWFLGFFMNLCESLMEEVDKDGSNGAVVSLEVHEK